ncbi:MAG: carbamoyltransferase HypF [Acidobacteria bacterium]|nr:carbamoyltransferase HypF [Acidobacteriota bacterium]
MTKPEKKTARRRIEIGGVVQGVGFRPFVYACANRFAVTGFVGNESKGVFIEIEGAPETLDEFTAFLKENVPPLAHISSIDARAVAPVGDADFRIIESESHAADFTLVSPDISICADCLGELFDPEDRRHLYPFINCTNCGPRFTITKTVPYDRPNTTMADFAMCPACRTEYENPLDRRFHAQPIACWDCGVRAWFESENFIEDDPRRAVAAAREALKDGRIAAVKGIGGFHLSCDARNRNAVETLRQRKGRIDKPFALMCRDLETARRFVLVDAAEEKILTSKERPIVLLKKKTDHALSGSIAPNNEYLGVMLPYSPLHFLLFDDALDVLVMTSANFTDEPIVRDNDEAREKLAVLADAFLFHDREIFVQCDDSVVRINDDAELPVRRSRGFAPFPVELPFAVPQVLAVGGELKATFCVTRENFAFMSQHIGDMENLETLRAFEKASEQMKRLFRVAPERVVGDLHPNYLSSIWAKKNFPNFTAVQHHHAHIAAVMAENKLPDEKVLGFAFDGTGFGTDGKIWGGEVLAADYRDFARVAQLRYFPLAGGDVAVKKIYRVALALLAEAGVEWTPELPCVAACPETERRILRKQLENNLNTVATSSFGRLFDAVAAISGVRQQATYEAQAAIEFEAVLDENVKAAYEFELIEGETVLIDHRPLVRQIVEDVRRGVEKAVVSAKFHNAAAHLIRALSRRFRARLDLDKIALSGGCFQNTALLKRAVKLLKADGFEVFTHRLVPPNDGGLALGQAMIAAVRSMQN